MRSTTNPRPKISWRRSTVTLPTGQSCICITFDAPKGCYVEVQYRYRGSGPTGWVRRIYTYVYKVPQSFVEWDETFNTRPTSVDYRVVMAPKP